MEYPENCSKSFRFESFDKDGNIVIDVNQDATDDSIACVTVLDLSTINPRAIGFRRGFIGTYTSTNVITMTNILCRLSLCLSISG